MMSDALDVRFAAFDAAHSQTLVLLCGPDLALGPTTQKMIGRAKGAVQRATAAADFKGKLNAPMEMLAPEGLAVSRLVLLGTGKTSELNDQDWVNLGGVAYAQVAARRNREASLFADASNEENSIGPRLAAQMAFGAQLRSYSFRKYRSREDEDTNSIAEPHGKLQRLTIHCSDPKAAREAYDRLAAVAEGVKLARDLVNEPANMLGTVELAEQARQLSTLGVEIDMLEEEHLRALKMNALLGVAQGSDRPPRVVVMQWMGAKSKRTKPLCFVGKGVVFDTGGLSMKPAGGMEDMKGDMGGAACVIGLMRALAGRKAPVNVVGLVGIVENMPSSKAQRPGDIVTTMSGQTVEVLNTDAEGRLVLADVLWYAQNRFSPRMIIDLATLTGAIIVALGKEYAGLFSNDDGLSIQLAAAGEATGEKVWRMPLAKAYDKLIDGRFADIKNIGGRNAGSITAAQFLQRFIKDTPWAHLDIAGTAMDSPRNDVNQSWASGWGVRLLDRLVSDNYEKSGK